MKEILKTYFNFPSKAVFAQVATLSETGPNIRTMRLWEANQNGDLLFLPALDTNKCSEILVNSHVALCFYLSEIGQLTVWGDAQIFSMPEHNQKLLPYWRNLPSETRYIYEVEPSRNKIPAIFAAINIKIFRYEWLELHANYLKSKRTLFNKINLQFQSISMPITS